jgi:hypothetical protein
VQMALLQKPVTVFELSNIYPFEFESCKRSLLTLYKLI